MCFPQGASEQYILRFRNHPSLSKVWSTIAGTENSLNQVYRPNQCFEYKANKDSTGEKEVEDQRWIGRYPITHPWQKAEVTRDDTCDNELVYHDKLGTTTCGTHLRFLKRGKEDRQKHNQFGSWCSLKLWYYWVTTTILRTNGKETYLTKWCNIMSKSNASDKFSKMPK